MLFFIGARPNYCHRFERCLIPMNRLKTRKKPIVTGELIIDSSSPTFLIENGTWYEKELYLERVERLREIAQVNSIAFGIQDWLCKDVFLERTGLTVEKHQILTIESYVYLKSASTAQFIPTLQGKNTQDYLNHLKIYGDLLEYKTWAGVGSLVGRKNQEILSILQAIKMQRPDLRLHGFGLGIKALSDSRIVDLLWSADSSSWAMGAWRAGGKSDCPEEAIKYLDKLYQMLAKGYDLPKNLSFDFTPKQLEWAEVWLLEKMGDYSLKELCDRTGYDRDFVISNELLEFIFDYLYYNNEMF